MIRTYVVVVFHYDGDENNDDDNINDIFMRETIIQASFNLRFQ